MIAEFQCPEGYIKCRDSLQCLPEVYWCDGVKNDIFNIQIICKVALGEIESVCKGS